MNNNQSTDSSSSSSNDSNDGHSNHSNNHSIHSTKRNLENNPLLPTHPSTSTTPPKKKRKKNNQCNLLLFKDFALRCHLHNSLVHTLKNILTFYKLKQITLSFFMFHQH